MSHESGIVPMPVWLPSDHLDTIASVTTFAPNTCGVAYLVNIKTNQEPSNPFRIFTEEDDRKGVIS